MSGWVGGGGGGLSVFRLNVCRVDEVTKLKMHDQLTL